MLDFDKIETGVEWQSAGASRMREYRKTPKYKRTPHASGVRLTLLEMPICAIDGEGKSRPDGSHDYTLLAASWPSGRARIESESISTQQCFDFIMGLPEHHTYVIYGGNYDFNMMLRDLPRAVINLLLDRGRAYWHWYRIRWIEHKFFSLSFKGKTITIYDVLANWQTTFVEACKAWEIGTTVELDLVQSMKEKRGDFEHVDDASISDYCYLECDLLQRLCRKLFDAILQTGYRPNAVYGPGALASAAMRKHRVKTYMAELPEKIELLTHYAYFGGRFDCSMFGWFQDVWQYDIKSAYPDQIRYLPCLAHAEWIKDHAPREIGEYGLYQVEWEFPADCAWPPFPHRDDKGNVYYPYYGKGWYHAVEIRAAQEYAKKVGGTIRIPTGWRLQRHCNHVPFDFVDAIFEIRKNAPSYAQGVVFKLILNSLYGKLAQQVGTDGNRKPPFQCFYWAGAITAGTRAKLIRALSQCPEQIIGIATDSLMALRELDLDTGNELGQWDSKHLSEYAQISNGVYKATDSATGKPVERARGFGRANVDWQDIKRDYLESKGLGNHSFKGKSRFITLRESRNRLDRTSVECRWIAPVRTIQFFPSRRWPDVDHYDARGPTMPLQPLEPERIESQPFKLKTASQEVIDARNKFNAYAWQDY